VQYQLPKLLLEFLRSTMHDMWLRRQNHLR
jgi:hypothetical protein